VVAEHECNRAANRQ